VKRIAALLVGIVAVTSVTSVTAPAYAAGIDDMRARAAQRVKLEGGLGDEALDAQKYDEAIEHYTKAIEANACGGDCGRYYFKRGLAYQGKEDCAKAVADYEKAGETLTDNGELYFNEWVCQTKLNQLDPALASLNKAIKVNPDSTIYRDARCIILFNKKDFAGALPDCEMTLGSAPDDKQMLYATAMSAEQTGDKAKAAKYYKHLLDLDHGNTQASDGLKRVGG
jgi:tetratricopeptide (TPR) repeat protein